MADWVFCRSPFCTYTIEYDPATMFVTGIRAQVTSSRDNVAGITFTRESDGRSFTKTWVKSADTRLTLNPNNAQQRVPIRLETKADGVTLYLAGIDIQYEVPCGV